MLTGLQTQTDLKPLIMNLFDSWIVKAIIYLFIYCYLAHLVCLSLISTSAFKFANLKTVAGGHKALSRGLAVPSAPQPKWAGGCS